jgi:hypothetical protein
MGYGWMLLSGVLVFTLHFPAFIVCIAFNMGTDMVSILSNPIGQPMATVSLFTSLRTTKFLISLIDHLQQSRFAQNPSNMELDHPNHVCCPSSISYFVFLLIFLTGPWQQ